MFSLLVALALAGTTLEVPGDYPSIETALDAAAPDDTIRVAPGTYGVPGGKTAYGVHVVGSGPDTILVRNGNGPVVDAGNGDAVVLSDLTLDGAGEPPVRCIRGSVTLSDVTLVAGGPSYRSGGGLVYAEECTLWMERTTASATIIPDDGAHVYAVDSGVVFIDAAFSGGEGGNGGSLYALRSSVSVLGGSFTGNQGFVGGSAFLDDSTSVFQDVTFTGNASTANGGGLFATLGALTVVGGRLEGQAASGGGGLFADGTDLVVRGATFAGNTATIGGGLACTAGTCLVMDSTFEGNSSADDGGAVHITSAGAKWTRSLFCDNISDDGGAVYVDGGVSTSAGGNIYVRNEATDRGGALMVRFANASISHETFVGNTSADRGAAAFVRDGDMEVTNSLLAQHDLAEALDHRDTTMGTGYDWFWNNAFGDAAFPLDATDTTGIDPLVADLGSTGCDRADYALLPGSPLIDAGDGALEPDGTPPDIGATGGPGAALDSDGDGVLDAEDCDPLDAGVGNEQLVWPDGDSDGVGARVPPTAGCPGPGLATVGGDCDDADPNVYPGRPEVPGNGIDDDCDGLIDDADDDEEPTWYADLDGDGFGDPDAPIEGATQPPDTADNPDDCDDSDAAVNPDAQETCTGVDDDCDGLIDDDDPDVTGGSDWWGDFDNDGYGDVLEPKVACVAPPQTTDNPDDCDDGNAAVNPGAPEVCNDIDDDCDGLIDADDDLADGGPYIDADDDGYGDDALPTVDACETEQNTAAVGGDCDDTDPDVNPGATEIWYDGVDQDCDGNDDDRDDDGFPVDEDCADRNPRRNPDATDVPDDGIDQDCDGVDAVFTYRAGGCGCDADGAGQHAGSWWAPLARRR